MVNYRLIDQAITYFRMLGYRPVDAPWFVSRASMEVTSPPGVRYCSSFLGDLVASGEQSFIEMFRNGDLLEGRHLCVTPCFRDEPILDELRRNYFFKVELIDYNPKDVETSLNQIIMDAFIFFNTLLPVKIVDTEIGKDIFWEDIELGSYGHRIHGDFSWVYGTGCAEPRLSHAIERYKWLTV